MLVARDTHVDRQFNELCGVATGNENCVSDENYVPTLLATYDAVKEVSLPFFFQKAAQCTGTTFNGLSPFIGRTVKGFRAPALIA